MTRQSIFNVSTIGIVTGIVLALFLRAIELTAGQKVYTLLLNIDYIPILNTIQFPEIVEVAFHIIISIAVCLGLYLFIRFKPINNIVLFSISVNVLIAIFYFPMTLLSDRTPEFKDVSALMYWVVGHVIYGWLVGYLLVKYEKCKMK